MTQSELFRKFQVGDRVRYVKKGVARAARIEEVGPVRALICFEDRMATWVDLEDLVLDGDDPKCFGNVGIKKGSNR